MAQRSRTSESPAPRADREREWELFVREEPSTPLKHVGSIRAPTPALAREQAEQLLGWGADDLWLCPADETERYTANPLEER